MARSDGRIEPGQPLSSAISARAWNRCMDAADIVFGERYSKTSGARTLYGNQRVVVKVPSSSQLVTAGNSPISVGHGFALPIGSLLSTASNATNNVVASESDLPAFDTSTMPVSTVTGTVQYYYATSRCGVVESVSDDGSNKLVTVLAAGIVRCRVLILNDGPAALPPAPYPSSSQLQPYWRRYLISGEYGYAGILAMGAKYWLRGANNYPYIAECLVHLG